MEYSHDGDRNARGAKDRLPFRELLAEHGPVIYGPEVLPALRQRLRRSPSRSTVPGSLPVLFFGDLFTARIATLGLNSSDQEYLTPSEEELTGAARRFETLTSLGARDRTLLTDGECDRAIQRMRDYFRPKGTVYTWFKALDRICRGMDCHFDQAEVAHLDLAQEATSPTWSALAKTSPSEHAALREADLPFLLWELQTFPIQAVVCNGRTPLDALRAALGVRIMETGPMRRIQWSVGKATCAGRTIGVVGWNLPLAQPTGLSVSDLHQLGALLGSRLRQIGAL